MKKKKTGAKRGAFRLRRRKKTKTALLFKAIEFRNAKGFRRLLAKGIRPNAEDKYGYSVLFRAVEWGTTEMVEALLKAGAGPNWAHHAHKMTPLQVALTKKMRKRVARLLVEYGANPFRFTDGRLSYAEIAELHENASAFTPLPLIRAKWEARQKKR